MTRRYGKPLFGLDTTIIEGEAVPVVEEILWRRPFCGLLHFKRQFKKSPPKQSKLLIVAPMSGHYATLLRGTVEAFLPTHDVYITDWSDARSVPLTDGGRTFLNRTKRISRKRPVTCWYPSVTQ